MRISEEKIAEIQAKADIVSVISKHTKLQKKGQDYVGLCLFHQDNNPSMSVSQTKRYFKCFSCGVGGNVFEFLMKYKHISFVEAVIELANEFHVDLPTNNFVAKKEKYSEKQKTLFAINEAAMKYYQVNLNASVGSEAKEYLIKRQIDLNQIKEWEIGFALGNEIVKHLTSVGYTDQDVVNAGLATKHDYGIKDYFTNRIVFPIKNQDGYVIGFSGRVLNGEQPKYLNTRETDIFHKSDVLFNLNQVWKIKERLDSVILLEGFMDVIALEKIGVKNSMALMGTAFSKFHLKTILEIKKPVKLFLDGDKPGVEAMYKIAKLFIQNQIKFTIIDNVSGHDPDELVNQGQSSQVLKMIDQPINPYEYFIHQFLSSHEKLNLDLINEVSQKILELLVDETNYVLVDQVIKNLSTRLKVSESALKNELNQLKPQQHFFEKKIVVDQPSFKKALPVNKNFLKYDHSRNRIFISLLKSDEFLDRTEPIVGQISGNNFSMEKLFKSLINLYRSNQYSGNNLALFYSLLNKEDFVNEELTYLKKILDDEVYGFNSKIKFTKQEFNDAVKLFQIRDLEKQWTTINTQLKKIEEEQELETDSFKREIIKQKLANSQAKAKILNDKILEAKKKENHN